MKTNLTFICLLPNYSKNVSKYVGEKLEMFYADVEDMMEYELGDITHILTVLGSKEGKQYIRSTESRVIKNIASFENALINISPSTLFSNRNYDKVAKSSYIIYLQISLKYIMQRAEDSKDSIDEKLVSVAFTEKDKMYVEKSDIVVNCSTLKEKRAVKTILASINTFFKKQKKEQK